MIITEKKQARGKRTISNDQHSSDNDSIGLIDLRTQPIFITEHKGSRERTNELWVDQIQSSTSDILEFNTLKYRNDSFDTMFLKLASVASELEFQRENASETHDELPMQSQEEISMTQLKKANTPLIDNLNMSDVTFQQRVLSRLIVVQS